MYRGVPIAFVRERVAPRSTANPKSEIFATTPLLSSNDTYRYGYSGAKKRN